jgi:transposase
MNITAVGIDLAKLVFQVHGVNGHGKAVIRKQLKRTELTRFFSNLPACLIGMEACSSAHYWARKLIEQGHTVKLIAPQFVKPYVKTNKNDAADAEAICEAVGRPNMRFVPIKNTEQQALLGMHRARQGFVTERTAQANQIRGLLAEFGLVMPAGIRSIGRKLPEFLEDAENGLSGASRALFARLFEHFRALDRQVEELEREIGEAMPHNRPRVGIVVSPDLHEIGEAEPRCPGQKSALHKGARCIHIDFGQACPSVDPTRRGCRPYIPYNTHRQASCRCDAGLLPVLYREAPCH